MVTKAKPYVGICGVATVEEAKSVVSLIRNSGFTLQTDHIPMVGFHVSSKSLELGFSEGNRRVPHFNQLPHILKAFKGEVFPTIHYYTRRPEMLVLEVGRILDYENLYNARLVDGIQVNMHLPYPYQVKVLKDIYPELKIAIETIPDENSVKQLAPKLVRDYGKVDYVVLDPSHGRGKEFDMGQAVTAYKILRDSGFEADVVFAGGFNGNNVRGRVNQLKDALGSKGFSIDATGGLRDNVGEGYGNDVLNLAKAAAYLRGASEMLLHNDGRRNEETKSDSR